VVAAPITLSLNSSVGRDLESAASVTVIATAKPSAVTVASSDPTKLLISLDGIAVGQPSMSLPWPSTGSPQVYLQSLSDSGTVTVTVSAPSYQTSTTAVKLAPSAAVFSNVTGGNYQDGILTNMLQQPVVSFAALDPITFQPAYGSQLPRPGANISVGVTSSNPTVLAVDTPNLNIAVANPAKPPYFQATLQPLAPGTAIVSLVEYPTAGTPSYGSEAVYNLSAPTVNLPSFSIGQDLMAPTQITLGNSVPTPSSSQQIEIFSSTSAPLANSPTALPSSVIFAIIPAGQRVSQPFYMQGVQLGAIGLSYYPDGAAFQASAYVVPTAFVFEEASRPQPLTLSTGSSSVFTVIPEVEPPTAAALSPLSIRPGVTVSIAVTSSNPAVLSVTSPRVFLNGGDQQVSVSLTAVAPGQATITLSGQTYDFSQPQASISVIVK
jgi:hypothetical protein